MTGTEELTDLELVERAKKGDSACLDLLIRKYAGYVRKITRNRFMLGGDIEDMQQEGLLAIIQAVDKYDPSKNKTFAAFVYMCIESRTIDCIRQATRDKHRALNSALSIEDENVKLGANGIIDADPLTTYLRAEQTESFYAAVEKHLNEKQKSVLSLFLDGYSYLYIAEKLGMSKKNVDNTLTAIKAKLRKNLKNDD